jgi:hypothetical protein
MKSLHIGAGQKQQRIGGAAKIKLRSYTRRR